TTQRARRPGCRSLPSSAIDRRSMSLVGVGDRSWVTSVSRGRSRFHRRSIADLSPTGRARYHHVMGLLARIVRSITLVGVAAVGFVVLAPRAASADDRPLYYARALTPADLEGRTLR